MGKEKNICYAVPGYDVVTSLSLVLLGECKGKLETYASYPANTQH